MVVWVKNHYCHNNLIYRLLILHVGTERRHINSTALQRKNKKSEWKTRILSDLACNVTYVWKSKKSYLHGFYRKKKSDCLSLKKKHVTRIAYNKKQNLDTIMYYEKKNLEAKEIEKTQPDL